MNRLTEPTVIFRCDGGNLPETGTGHIRRCLNLAIYLRDTYKVNSRFIIRDLDGEPPLVLHHRFAVHLLPPVSDWETPAMRIVKRVNPQLVVVDMLDNGGKFLKLLHDQAPAIPTITMDDLGMGLDYASCGINSILEDERAEFNGEDFVILASGEESAKVIKDEVKEVFLSFGGFDFGGLTAKALRSLTLLDEKLEVTALVGRSYNNEEKLLGIASGSNIRRLDIVRETSNIGYLLKKSDISIVAGGLTLYESMHCGLPTMVLCQYDHQVGTAAKFQSKGAAINLGLGEKVDDEFVSSQVKALIDDYDKRKNLSETAAGLVDGKGLRRVAEIINTLANHRFQVSKARVKVSELTKV
ncbi:MAG: hypothetical protein GF307_13825 [candidate division Zixibacteria bacterium]|nr:hypothetical protein [candidate division Zixibacteria bacterium]